MILPNIIVRLKYALKRYSALYVAWGHEDSRRVDYQRRLTKFCDLQYVVKGVYGLQVQGQEENSSKAGSTMYKYLNDNVIMSEL